MYKTNKLREIYLELGNRKTAFPKDMSFKEIYDNKLFVPAQFYDSASIKWHEIEIEEFILKNNTLILGEPGTGKSFFSYCLIRESFSFNSYMVLPIDLKLLFEANLLKPFEKIVQYLFGKILLNRNLIFIVDGVDEFCGSEKRDKFCKELLTILKQHGKVCMLCRRYEYDLYISNIVESNMFVKILSIREWRIDKEFKQYLQIISIMENIDVNQYYEAIITSEQLSELVRRPLHARMLIYVIKTSFKSIHYICNVADLYEQYFASLATTVKSVGQNKILNFWRQIAWNLFFSSTTANRKIYVSEIEYSMLKGYSTERIIAPIVNWSNDMGRKSFSFLHYSFYEFLVAYNFVIELCKNLEKDEINLAKCLFRKDFSLEIRHYCTLLLKNYKNVMLWNKLILFYELEKDNTNLTERRITNNLVLYFIGRISRIGLEELYTVLDNEEDIFSKTSIYWAMCNLNYTSGLLEYLNKLRDLEYASLNRGYLMYYYGDMDRNLDPPYEDNNVTNNWSKTHLKNLIMFQGKDYDNIPVARRIIDVYTFIDFASFHKSKIPQEEIRCLKNVINNIPMSDIYIEKSLKIINDYLEDIL